MAINVVSDYWQGLQSRQSDWAFHAYARLISTLSQDVQEKLNHKDGVEEPYVVIFGKTQVGKTTLLLDLMGVNTSQMAIVSQVLRGGRETGKSATATAMEYCRSTDNRWGLSFQSTTQWLDSNQSVMLRLRKLREDMEAGRLVVTSPCVVHIPRHFFAQVNTSTPHVRILDLPGDNPANSEEQSHVNQMAKAYLPFADLILLVGRGDDLGFLRPDAITLPGLEDWQTMPHRFRIVTTYSYTAQSIKDFIRNDAQFDVAQLRRRLIQQVELFGSLSEAARSEDLYFPLEFGNSWTSVKHHEPMLHARIAPIIEKLRKELLDQIGQSTSPMGRLRSTLNTHLSVKYIQKKRTAAIERTICQLAENGKTLTCELAEWERLIERSQSKASSIQHMLTSNSLQSGAELVRKAAGNPQFSLSDPYPPTEESKKDDAAILKRLIACHKRSLKGMHLTIESPSFQSRKYWAMVRNKFAEPGSDVVQKVLDDEFSFIRAKLFDFTVETYLSSSNYQSDRSTVLNSSLNAMARLATQFEEAWLTALKSVDTELHLLHTTASNERLAYEEERDKALKEKRLLELHRSQERSELERITRRSQEDMERCDRFVHLLDEEYLAVLSTKMNDALQTEDDCEALLQILACEDMKIQRNDLMKMNLKQAGQEE